MDEYEVELDPEPVIKTKQKQKEPKVENTLLVPGHSRYGIPCCSYTQGMRHQPNTSGFVNAKPRQNLEKHNPSHCEDANKYKTRKTRQQREVSENPHDEERGPVYEKAESLRQEENVIEIEYEWGERKKYRLGTAKQKESQRKPTIEKRIGSREITTAPKSTSRIRSKTRRPVSARDPRMRKPSLVMRERLKSSEGRPRQLIKDSNRLEHSKDRNIVKGQNDNSYARLSGVIGEKEGMASETNVQSFSDNLEGRQKQQDLRKDSGRLKTSKMSDHAGEKVEPNHADRTLKRESNKIQDQEYRKTKNTTKMAASGTKREGNLKASEEKNLESQLSNESPRVHSKPPFRQVKFSSEEACLQVKELPTSTLLKELYCRTQPTCMHGVQPNLCPIETPDGSYSATTQLRAINEPNHFLLDIIEEPVTASDEVQMVENKLLVQPVTISHEGKTDVQKESTTSLSHVDGEKKYAWTSKPSALKRAKYSQPDLHVRCTPISENVRFGTTAIDSNNNSRTREHNISNPEKDIRDSDEFLLKKPAENNKHNAGNLTSDSKNVTFSRLNTNEISEGNSSPANQILKLIPGNECMGVSIRNQGYCENQGRVDDTMVAKKMVDSATQYDIESPGSKNRVEDSIMQKTGNAQERSIAVNQVTYESSKICDRIIEGGTEAQETVPERKKTERSSQTESALYQSQQQLDYAMKCKNHYLSKTRAGSILDYDTIEYRQSSELLKHSYGDMRKNRIMPTNGKKDLATKSGLQCKGTQTSNCGLEVNVKHRFRNQPLQNDYLGSKRNWVGGGKGLNPLRAFVAAYLSPRFITNHFTDAISARRKRKDSRVNEVDMWMGKCSRLHGSKRVVEDSDGWFSGATYDMQQSKHAVEEDGRQLQNSLDAGVSGRADHSPKAHHTVNRMLQTVQENEGSSGSKRNINEISRHHYLGNNDTVIKFKRSDSTREISSDATSQTENKYRKHLSRDKDINAYSGGESSTTPRSLVKRKPCLFFSFIIAGLVLALLTTIILMFRNSAAKAPNLPEAVESPHVEGGQGYYIPHDINNGSVAIPQGSLGLRIVKRDEWLGQPSLEKTKLAVPVPYVIVSHTGTEMCFRQEECTYLLRTIQNFHVESRGWWDIAYNFLIGGGGEVYEGRGWGVAGPYAYAFSNRSIGVSLIGDYSDFPPTNPQLMATQRLISEGIRLQKIHPNYKLVCNDPAAPTNRAPQALVDTLSKWRHWSEYL